MTLLLRRNICLCVFSESFRHAYGSGSHDRFAPSQYLSLCLLVSHSVMHPAVGAMTLLLRRNICVCY